ncbi:MAG: prolyl-tRNA synthetase [Frankiales bacterium]|nr:prolyl-tRNA synthetase [Frankiales bacterium]
MAAGKIPVLTPRSTGFPRWYQDIVSKAELADNGPVRGTMVIRPYGYAIWERMVAEMDARIKLAGAENAYFPLFIPESYLRREAEHVEGFSPELAVVTHAGGKQLEEAVVVRPTSETVIGEFMAKWVQSYRDLPLLLNQWANVVRWEKRPRIFLRTSEFLWQEGHTAHASYEDARNYARQILHETYQDFMVNVLAIPVVVGRKTARERFAGAVNTTCCEAMTGDGKALQMGTSHELGQNFAKAFRHRLPVQGQQTRAGLDDLLGTSTRMVGGLIMVHGDDGLRVPPALAPIQIVVTAIKDEVVEAVHKIGAELRAAGVRVRVDDRTDIPFGRRAIDWELKGIPLRIEVGPRDLAAGTAMIARRLTGGPKTAIALTDLVDQLPQLLANEQQVMLTEATVARDGRIVEVASIDEAAEAAVDGWAKVEWSVLGVEGEAKLAQSAVTVRCLQRADRAVPDTEDEPGLVAYVARSY